MSSPYLIAFHFTAGISLLVIGLKKTNHPPRNKIDEMMIKTPEMKARLIVISIFMIGAGVIGLIF